MRKKKLKKMLVEVAALLHETADTLRSYAARIAQELAHDHICGGWVHQNNTCRASVYKTAGGYRVAVFKGRKLVERQTVIVRGSQLFIDCAEGLPPQQVIHYRGIASLVLGGYGLFQRDDQDDNQKSE